VLVRQSPSANRPMPVPSEGNRTINPVIRARSAPPGTFEIVTPRPLPLCLSLACAAVLVVGCSSSTPNKVEVVEGEPTTTTAAPVETVPAEDLGEPTLSDTSEVTTVGLDTVEFGMTFDEAQQAAGTRLAVVEGDAGSSCYRVHAEKGPEGVTFLVSNSTVERVDIDSGPVTTRSGAGIGMPVGELTTLFPERLEPSPSPTGTTFTFVPTDEQDAQYRIIFETDGATVTSFRAGKLPEVTDGC
jgi:hypothetical protein